MNDTFVLEMEEVNKRGNKDGSNKLIVDLIQTLVVTRAQGMMVKSYNLKLEFVPAPEDDMVDMVFGTRGQ